MTEMKQRQKWENISSGRFVGKCLTRSSVMQDKDNRAVTSLKRFDYDEPSLGGWIK